MSEPEKFTAKDHSINALQGLVKSIPYAGSLLDQVAFGAIAELRMRRIDTTLREIAESLGESRAKNVGSEEYVNLLELLLPQLARATSEEKRLFIRGVLFNAATNDKEETDWDGAVLAATLVSDIDPAGLALLGGVAKYKGKFPVSIVSKPEPQVYAGDFNFDTDSDVHHPLRYQWPIVEYWARFLRDKRMITYSSHDARGGFGSVALGQMGEFLIQWVLAK